MNNLKGIGFTGVYSLQFDVSPHEVYNKSGALLPTSGAQIRKPEKNVRAVGLKKRVSLREHEIFTPPQNICRILCTLLTMAID